MLGRADKTAAFGDLGKDGNAVDPIHYSILRNNLLPGRRIIAGRVT
jgi:hypothetical protein